MPRPTVEPTVDAVIFDWGGTLTRWHDIDFHAESLALAQAVVNAPHHDAGEITDAPALRRRRRSGGGAATTSRAPRWPTCSTRPGLEHDPGAARRRTTTSGSRTRFTDPEVGPMFEALRADGIRVGVLSNTIWPRAWHEGFFERDGVLHLIDGDVYTSEIPWTKPSERRSGRRWRRSASSDPARCVYVGDRLFDDVWGAHNAGLRAIHIPHSAIPPEQIGHTEGEPGRRRAPAVRDPRHRPRRGPDRVHLV